MRNIRAQCSVKISGISKTLPMDAKHDWSIIEMFVKGTIDSYYFFLISICNPCIRVVILLLAVESQSMFEPAGQVPVLY